MNVRAWIFCCAAVLPLPVLADTPADFSGEWVLSNNQGGDKAASTDTPATGAHSGGGGYGGRGGGMGGGGGHHGRHSQDATNNSAGAGATALGDPRLHANSLIIRQSDVVFDIAANGGQRMVYRFDNRNNYGAPYGGTVTLTWSTPEMVIETHPDGGGSIEEHYSLSADEKKLILRIREQKSADDTIHETTRSFVRNQDDTSATQGTLPPP